MVHRRPLTDGVPTPPASIDPQRERDFVNGTKAVDNPAPTPTNPNNRVPISTRMRSEFANALKRASLERQLEGIEPNTLQDILEQAVEPWLRNNGYIR